METPLWHMAVIKKSELTGKEGAFYSLPAISTGDPNTGRLASYSWNSYSCKQFNYVGNLANLILQ